jgi:hypothetical protein
MSSPVLDALDVGWYPLPDVTVQEMCLFLAIIVQMGQDQRDTLKDYWSTLEQYFMAFYRKNYEMRQILSYTGISKF